MSASLALQMSLSRTVAAFTVTATCHQKEITVNLLWSCCLLRLRDKKKKTRCSIYRLRILKKTTSKCIQSLEAFGISYDYSSLGVPEETMPKNAAFAGSTAEERSDME